MKSARLNVRWHGHALGALVHGRDAENAVAAGRAEFVTAPRKRKIRTGNTSPTREPSTEETTSDDDNGADGTDPPG